MGIQNSPLLNDYNIAKVEICQGGAIVTIWYYIQRQCNIININLYRQNIKLSIFPWCGISTFALHFSLFIIISETSNSYLNVIKNKTLHDYIVVTWWHKL